MILDGLRSPAIDQATRRSLIIEAEACSFSELQLPALRPVLRNFAVQFRDSTDRVDQIAVSSAIRKFVATMSLDELPSASFVLDAGPLSSPPIAIELEVTKMVVRKLAANPPITSGASSDLEARIVEMAKTYLNDRLLMREKHGATALNAVLALALLDSSHLDDCVTILHRLRSRWFVDHLAHRARELTAELQGRNPADRIARQIDNLSKLSLVPNTVER